MPSSGLAYKAIIEWLDNSTAKTIIDLGSGWGNIVIRLAKDYPNRQVVGYELSFLPWLTSLILKKSLGLSNLTIYRKNFYQARFPTNSILICYLFPQAMQQINDKLRREKSSINMLISNNFALPSWQADKTVRINDFYRSYIYCYQLKK
jgi:16S rRNA A1518/A1519 N6-dimethyltransferase RsmA/KsgA/DIM1 with predicted DNA glycosylase/AP lyase activity